MGKRWAALLRILGVGWYIAACVVIGVWLGRWLDEKASTIFPLFTVLGALLALLVAYYGVYRMVLPLLGDRGGRNKENR